MKRYLMIICILSLFVFPATGFCEKIYSFMLSENFEAGTIEANSEILQNENFSITRESIKWFITANIYPKDYHNKRVYIMPYKRYIEFDENNSCYEEFNLFVLPLSKLIVVERQIINHTGQSQSYSDYGGTLINCKLK